ncbi:MAG: LIC_10190 family membrane protein [Solirubrobacterales bacterium]
MLYLVAAWIVLLAVAVPTGTAILRWTGGGGAFDRPGDRLVLSAWLGVLALGSALLAASFVFPLWRAVGLVMGLGLAAAALSWGAVREEIDSLRARLNPRLVVAFLALIGGVAVFTAQPVVYVDTGYYHAGAIRWLSQYGAVEGIALVQDQLGYASSWFALAAPFNPDGLRDHGMATMGGFALLLLALHALICVSRALGRTARQSDWLVIAGSPLLIALPKVQALVSPSPDIPVNVLVLVVGWAIFTVADRPRARISGPDRLSPGPAAVPLLLALGAMTLKPQAGALVAVAALFYVFAGGFGFHRAVWAAGLGIVALAPWLAYEFVATGCPAYPLPACADVAWSVGADTARETGERIGGAGPDFGPAGVWDWLRDDFTPSPGVLAVGSMLALGAVLAARSRPRLTPALRHAATWVAIAGAIGLLLFLVNAERILVVTLVCLSLVPLAGRHPGAGWLLAVGLAGIALTLSAGAQLRFAVGYMAVLFARLAVFQGPRIWMLLRPYLAPPGRLPRAGLATLLFAAALAAALAPLARPTSSSSQLERLGWLIPPKRPTLVTVEPANGIPYRVPVGPTTPARAQPFAAPGAVSSGLCWAAELPCARRRADPDVSLRDVVLRDPDRGIAGGFARSDRRR